MMLPSYAGDTTAPRRRLTHGLRMILAVALSLATLQYLNLYTGLLSGSESVQVPLRAPELLAKCQSLEAKPGPPPDFYTRTHSDRFVPGTKPTLITVNKIDIATVRAADISIFQNATIWTGGANGLEVLNGDILIDGGLIKRVGVVESDILERYADVVRLDAKGQWISPGYVLLFTTRKMVRD